ncbi:MAG TPA: peptidoglycan DD-metalloendopeptidase family protein [Candidatus Dormibacteraeota bacterium]|nr:peptidoglycan DD-metalloendopeptidase family protein [Candidatus Dormibacteraeota bacterium]
MVGAIVFAFFVLSAGPAAAAADTSPADPAQQLALIDQIRAQLGSNLADALAAQQQLRQSLQDNSAQQADLQAKIASAQQQIGDLDLQIRYAQEREAVLAGRIDAERQQLRQLARAVYVAPSSPLLVLAESNSLGDLLSRIADLNVAASQAAKVKSQLNVDLTELQAERQKEQDARDAEVKQRDQLGDELAQLRALAAQQEKSMADLETKIEQTRTEIWLLNRQSTQLAQQVTDMLQQQEDAIIAAAMQAVWTQVQLWSQSNDVGQIATSAGHSTKYRFIWPEPHAQISQPFGPSQFWFEPAFGGYPHFHTGIDLVEPFGSPVLAADDGVVALVGNSSSGYGNYVVIAHSGGLDTLYGHLATALVKVGQIVSQGQTIGLEGSTGNSTGPHVHFELRINQVPINPAPYLPPGQPSGFNA